MPQFPYALLIFLFALQGCGSDRLVSAQPPVPPPELELELTDLQWVFQDSHSDASLRGLSVVDDLVAWAGGSGGTVLRTTDGGPGDGNRAPA